MRPGTPLLLVTVGTDHHPFDRLVRWASAWLDGHPGRLRCLMQTGTSAPPAGGVRGTPGVPPRIGRDRVAGLPRVRRPPGGHGLGGRGRLPRRSRDHPGARHRGAVPIVVPRQHRLGEHVDDHQVAFSRRLAADGGGIHLAETETGLHRLLDRVAADRPPSGPGPRTGPPPAPCASSSAWSTGWSASGRSRGRRPREHGPVHRRARAQRQHPARPDAGPPGGRLVGGGAGPPLGARPAAEQPLRLRRALRRLRLLGQGRSRRLRRLGHPGRRRGPGPQALGRPQPLCAPDGRARPVARLPGPHGHYLELLERLYAAVHEVSGKPLVVDASKHASSAFLVRRLHGIDLRLVHLVRDSRGVAFSWTKLMRRAEVVEGDDLMATDTPLRMSGRYLGYNLLFHLVRRLGVPTLRLRYESLVRDPVPELTRVLGHAGRPRPPASSASSARAGSSSPPAMPWPATRCASQWPGPAPGRRGVAGPAPPPPPPGHLGLDLAAAAGLRLPARGRP